MKENHLALFCRVSKRSRTSLTFCCAYSDSDTVLKFAICCSMAVRQTHCFALNDGLDHFSSNISTLYYTADPSQQASRCERSFRPPKRHAHPEQTHLPSSQRWGWMLRLDERASEFLSLPNSHSSPASVCP